MVTRRRDGRSATWEDLDALPESVVGEIVEGEIVATPRPDWPHADSASRIAILLGGAFYLGNVPGGWVILFEPRVRFGDDIRVPDLAGWRKERWVGVPRRGPIPVAPDWICEILSPSTERTDRTTKLAVYAAARVGHVWLVNPETRTLEAYRLEPQGWLLVGSHAGTERVRVEPFGAIELDLAQIFGATDDE